MSASDKRLDWTRPRVAVRKRTLNETLDLTLRVLGREFKPLAYYYALVAAPVFLLDLAIFAPFLLMGDGRRPDDFEAQAAFFFWSWVLISLEGRFAGSLATQYLGAWFFSRPGEKIERRSVVRSWRERWFQLFYYLVLTRLFSHGYYAETILLERTPFFKTKDRDSTRRRVRRIAQDSPVSPIASSILAESFLLCGAASGIGLIIYATKALIPESEPAFFVIDFALWPLFVFACRIFGVVFNFFQYINCRITGEGWDLVLSFETELAKLTSADCDAQPANGSNVKFQRSRTLGPIELNSDWLSESAQTPGGGEETP